MSDRVLVYYHRLHFPSASGQTIQVIRDYYALSLLGYNTHLLFRCNDELGDENINSQLMPHGAELSKNFALHGIVDGWLGQKRAIKKLKKLSSGNQKYFTVVTRTLDHAKRAINFKHKNKHNRIKVILELHETAIPHMVYGEQKRPLRAFISKCEEKKVFRGVDGILCTNYSQLTILDELFADHAEVIVLPNSFQPQLFEGKPFVSTSNKKEKDVFVLRYAGQFNEWKNTKILFEILQILPPNFILEIAGGSLGGDSKTNENIAKLAAEYGVEDRLKYYGFLAPIDVPAFIEGADCLVLPLGDNVQSRFFTSPMKLFEYASSGVPMVVASQPTTEALVTNEKNALMVEPGSPQGFAEAITKLARNPELADQLAGNAKDWVKQYSTINRAKRYDQFLTHLDEKQK